jgi:hypothetical protein
MAVVYTVETGAGIAGANTYFAIATADAYWTARPHDPNAAIWLAATQAKKEGAGMETASYMDATWGELYLGSRSTTTQGLLWPRVTRTIFDLTDYETLAELQAAQAETDTVIIGNDGLLLANLPAQIVTTAIELAARALSAPLAADVSADGPIKREKTGPIETEYFGPGPSDGSYGFVDRILAPVIIGMRNANWAWA